MTTQASATSTSPAPLTTRSRNQLAAAATLISIGAGSIALRAAETVPGSGSWIVLVVGLAFMAAHAVTRKFALLVPGGILTGLGTGIFVSQQLAGTAETAAAIVLLGLGVGFLSIWAVGSLLRVTGNHWWPLVPGGILAVVGVSLLAGGQTAQILDFWPVVLVGTGLLVLWRARVAARVAA
jgi:hypothetical protein